MALKFKRTKILQFLFHWVSNYVEYLSIVFSARWRKSRSFMTPLLEMNGVSQKKLDFFQIYKCYNQVYKTHDYL